MKAKILAFLGMIIAGLTAMLYRKEAKHQKAVKKGVQKARKTERDAADALIAGLEKEAKAREKVNDRINNRTR